MEADFWHEKWRNQQIGFHQEKVNSRLIKHWPSLGLSPGTTVLVPLCGKTHDLLWLADAGFQVTGVELSALACEQFFTENQLQPEIALVTAGKHSFKCYRTERITLWAGDFFALPEAEFARADGVYDRAALIALPPEMRVRYAAALADRLQSGSRVLLITMDYDASKMNGPPFPVPGSEVEQLYSNQFEIRLLSESSGPEFVGNLKERGLDTLHEQVFALTRM